MSNNAWEEFTNPTHGFIKYLGVHIDEVREGYCKGTLKLEDKHGNPIGSIHGGVLFSIADTVGGVCATAGGRIVTTVDADIHYMRAAYIGDTLITKAHEVKSGKLLSIVEVKNYNQDGKLLTSSTFTYHYLSNQMDVDVELEKLKQL
ncbi:PaaI family thioesterase [Eubacterium oxidoreducens]|uniref:Acyl-CoA thioesterase n=1 Tax=Eubacterium oxidoreducens TaxID=1732 RepID=A0A1G6AFV4_EUBOX|nr:PaaI family thioesterase [Eubacterium oxidoreducens]SDB07298.1 acyl-CoA thioesterase [Eubacterium oxidoreducens]